MQFQLKPNILDEINNDPTASAVNPPVDGLKAGQFVSASDHVVLEDESGRVTLKLEAERVPKVQHLVTGAVMAFLGTLTEDGIFDAMDCCCPGLPPQSQIRLPDNGKGSADPLLLLVSGLSLGDPNSDPLAADMLVDYITGNLGGSADHAEAACIAQVIVAGASCYNAQESARSQSEAAAGQASAKSDSCGGGDKIRAQHRLDASPLQELDLMLTRLCASVPVDVMAGPGDPCCMYMPQQPLLPCLLPSAKTYNTLRTTTNPYEASLDVKAASKGRDKVASGEGSGKPSEGILVMGTSGLPAPCAFGHACAVSREGQYLMLLEIVTLDALLIRVLCCTAPHVTIQSPLSSPCGRYKARDDLPCR
jgi:DNA polymerase delta subunit 2